MNEDRKKRSDFCLAIRKMVRTIVNSTLDRPSFGRVPMPYEIVEGMRDEHQSLCEFDPNNRGHMSDVLNIYGMTLRSMLRNVNARMQDIGDDAKPYAEVNCDYNLMTRKVVVAASVYICRERQQESNG